MAATVGQKDNFKSEERQLLAAPRISSHYEILSHLIGVRKPCDDDMTHRGTASTQLHISAALAAFTEVPKEVEPNRCNQGSQSEHGKYRAASRGSDPETATPARCKHANTYKRCFFFLPLFVSHRRKNTRKRHKSA